MKRQTLAVLAVVAALGFTAAAHGEAYAQDNSYEVREKSQDYWNRGAAAALAFDWIEACKWYALATAFGGTDLKKFYDGVTLILSRKERESCLENVHAESVQQLVGRLKAEVRLKAEAVQRRARLEAEAVQRREARLEAEQMARYRTDTFNRLRQVLGDRLDISIVGHRLVFQSEVLFATGEAEILQGGLAQLKHLATTLPDLIPQDVDCSLLVMPDDYSAALASARVAAVTESLSEQGFTRCRLTTNPFSPLLSSFASREIELEFNFTPRDPG